MRLSEKITKAIFSAFPSEASLGSFLSVKLNEDLNRINSSRPSTIGLYEYVVQYLQSKRKLISFFKEAVDGEYHDNEEVKNALRILIAQAGSHDGNPKNACLLYKRYPFINRQILRDHVEELSNGGGARILVVDGPPKSGRSFSDHFVTHFCEPNGIKFISIPLKDYLDKTAENLVKKIAMRFALDMDNFPIQNAQESQWVEELGEWLAGRIDKYERTIWLIFDDCSTAGLPQSIKELLIQLAEKVTYISNMRLIFLAHNEPFTGRPDMMTVYEKINQPTRNDLENFFRNCLTFHNLDLGDGLDAMTDEVWKQLSPSSNNFMAELCSKTKLAVEIFLND